MEKAVEKAAMMDTGANWLMAAGLLFLVIAFIVYFVCKIRRSYRMDAEYKAVTGRTVSEFIDEEEDLSSTKLLEDDAHNGQKYKATEVLSEAEYAKLIGRG